MQEKEYINIKDVNIPIMIRNYKSSRYLKTYFKADVLYISKPKYVSMKTTMAFIKQNEEYIYKKYTTINKNTDFKLKKWEKGEIFFYKGEKFTVETQNTSENKIQIKFDEENKVVHLLYPFNLDKTNRKAYIDKGMKKILKNNTEYLLEEKVPHWGKKTNISYKQFKVNDATSKFGSCIPSTKIMHFSSRLIMLPEDKIDAIVVHELCHIVYPNHSKDFYNLVRKYIPNYDEINKWLKENGKIIIF